jgi:hypothetical protein
MWKQINGWEKYLISNRGEIKSFQYSKPKILKQDPNNYGYLRVYLYDNKGFRKRYFVHKLVAEHFKENPNNYIYIDHINRIRYDNRASNLRWCTIEQNLKNRSSYKKKKYKSRIIKNVPF